MSHLRPGIIKLYQQGKKVNEISRLLEVPHQIVSYAINRFRETGSNEEKADQEQQIFQTTDKESLLEETEKVASEARSTQHALSEDVKFITFLSC